jgi:ABC-2 type transport system permease protein
MRILDIAIKDLQQMLRDKRAFLFIVAMPLVFTFFMGFAYRSMSQAPDPRLPLGLANQDPGGELSMALSEKLALVEGLRLQTISAEQAESAVRSGKQTAVLLVPSGFTEAILAGGKTQLKLVVDPFSNQGQTVMEFVRPVVMHLYSSLEIAEMSVEAVGARTSYSSEAAHQKEKTSAFDAAWNAWGAASGAGLVVEKVTSSQQESEAKPFGGNPYNQSSPGIMVMFTLFGLITSATLLVQERKSRTLQRMLTTSLHTWEIMAGHLLAMFALVLLQSFLLVIFGQLVLGVDYLRQPLGVLLVMTSLAAWASALGLLIGTIAKGDEQVIIIAMISMFLLSALGGAWFPLEGAGRLFAAVGKFTPTAWAMTGFQNLLVRGLSFDSTLLPSLVQLAYALGIFALAAWQFRKQVA